MNRARLDDSVEEAGEAITVVSEAVLVGGRRLTFVLLTAWLFVSIAFFASYWFRLPGNDAHPLMFAVASIGVGYLIAVWIAPWLSLARMSRPIPMPAPPGLRVAVVTTFVPEEESLELLEHSLAALIALDYPHDTWVLDEGDMPAARALCKLWERGTSRDMGERTPEEVGPVRRADEVRQPERVAREPGVGRI